VHQFDDAIVARGWHAEIAPARRHAAVDYIDLGQAPHVEVLQHRGADVAGLLHVLNERRVVEAVRIDMDRLEPQFLRIGHRHALSPEREHGVAALLSDTAVTQAGHRRETRESAVDQQL